ncbi:MAG: Hsp20/alpha crystallin family protein [Candidatus Methanodesulfokora sp.]
MEDDDPIDSWFKEIMKIFMQLEKDMRKMLEDEGIREVENDEGPFVYGYYYGLGPDGKPEIRYFGSRGEIKEVSEESNYDIMDYGDRIVVVAEVKEEEVYVEVHADRIRIEGENEGKELRLPCSVDPETASMSYRNNVLTIEVRKGRGTEVKKAKLRRS